MSIQACAELVQRGDPDRFLATMSAPPAARGAMFVLFAFNLELARAATASKEALIAEMRLQWWRDLLEQPDTAPPHEVGGPLCALIRDQGLDTTPLLAAVSARRQDIYAEGFTATAPLTAYLDDCTGGLLWAAARALGEDAAHEAAFRKAALAGAIANYVMAAPALRAKGTAVPAVADMGDLAQIGLEAWRSARAQRFTAARPVLRSLWQTPFVLSKVTADPRLALSVITHSEFSRRGHLVWLTLTNRW